MYGPPKTGRHDLEPPVQGIHEGVVDSACTSQARATAFSTDRRDARSAAAAMSVSAAAKATRRGGSTETTTPSSKDARHGVRKQIRERLGYGH